MGEISLSRKRGVGDGNKVGTYGNVSVLKRSQTRRNHGKLLQPAGKRSNLNNVLVAPLMGNLHEAPSEQATTHLRVERAAPSTLLRNYI